MTRLMTCLVLGLMSMVTNLQAQTPTFSIAPANISADPGDQFFVDIEVSNFVNLISFQYSMKWDVTLLQLDSINNYTEQIQGFGSNQVNPNNSGGLVASWFDNSLSPNTLDDGTVLYRLHFTALSGGNTDIEFTEDFASYEVINSDEEDVGLNTMNASASVTACAASVTTCTASVT
ncbi:MAG: cohesin domain-containing protein, partial [Bacteroidota bacterium]